MSEAPPPSPLVIDQLLRTRVTDAVIAQAAIRHPGLNAFLRERLSGRDIEQGALFSEPVIEGAASYRSSGLTPADLAGNLVHPKVAQALTAGSPGDDYRFVHPAYAHQVEAWRLLSPDQRKSVLVSSGTGSGKTECFLIPLLNDLAQESEAEGRLTGVRALMLYPLNALIASQEQRLRQWTRPFGGKIRFGLYNGLMKDARKHERDRAEHQTPEQVLYRKTLRNDPPPILVTNNTMLEYMTIRKQDQQILERSRGKLRWIIIDEAHSYVGSAAAEVSLLLRRVLQAFEVEPENVRFVATSATIGGSDEAAKADLRRYLADLSGAPIDQVHVVFGDRENVSLPSPDKSAGPLGPSRLSLETHPSVQSLVRAAEKGPVTLAQTAVHASACQTEPLALLERVAGRAGDDDHPLLPLRVHKFVRALPGLWSCLNPDCRGDKPKDWPFGAVLFDRTETCPHCQSPAFELINCRECGEPWLDTYDHGDQLTPRPSSPDRDEFASTNAMTEGGAFEVDEQEEGASDADDTSRVGFRRLLGLRPFAGGRTRTVCPTSGSLPERKSAGSDIWISGQVGDGACPGCGVGPTAYSGSPLWPFRFGAPFLLQNATPTLLEGVSSHTSERQLLPGEGRQLLSFTDSRQGTARFAANIETQSERGYIRAFIYHLVQQAGGSLGRQDEIDQLDREIRDLEAMVATQPLAQQFLDQKLAARAALDRPQAISWGNAVTALSEDATVSQWIRAVWDEDRDERFGDSPETLAEFLLLRELARRPRKANSVETMGLAQLQFPALEALSDAALPAELRSKALTIEDWRDYLYFLVDVVIRNTFVLRISDRDARWLLPRKAFLRQIVGPNQTPGRIYDQAWPVAKPMGITSNAVKALERVLELDASNPEHRATINDVLQRAWSAVSPLLEGSGSTYALDFRKATLAPIRNGWVCPVTNRVLSRLVFGVSPYSVRMPGDVAKPEPVQLPTLSKVFPKNAEDRASIEAKLEADPTVSVLRDKGVWSDLYARAAMLTPYYRAEEHSAQQPPHRLRDFEAQFRDYKINLLACSTTMEMGVDIGSVEAVLNTNVPPSIANYRQRVGRAGRRGQGFSSSLTFARDTPLDREAFRQPADYLKRALRVPRVKLDSEPIVQRHVNARLLAQWFKAAEGQLVKARSGEFFGCPADLKGERENDAPVEHFIRWLNDPSTAVAMSPALTKLARGTILEGRPDLLTAAAIAFREAEQSFGSSWGALREQAKDIDPSAIGAIEKPLRRMCGEPLLGELSNRSVLPGHGFPNAVVPFINECAETRDRGASELGEESNERRYNYPSRNADVAIREYAPGAEVVIDGLVWTSAGVTLNWRRPAHEPGAKDIQSLKNFWVCEDCQEPGSGHVRATSCVACGSDRLRPGRFLSPAGFKVGWRDRPHAHTDTAQYIEPEPPKISAGGAAWIPLFDATFGRYRSSHSGRLLHLSHGSGGAGYRICLECGRAALDGDASFDDHEALTPTKGSSGRCVGNDRAYARTEPLALGHETQTDVAELQPSGLASAGAAWALGSALRESLARELGIETRELGLAAEPRTGPIGDQTHSIFLWDVAAGGAGYAPQLFNDVLRVFTAAAERLACPLDCERGCSACVLAADLYAQQSIVDRKAALEFAHSILGAIGDPGKDDRVDDSCQLSAPVADAIVRRLRAGNTAALFVSSEFDVTALGNPPFSTLFAAAQRVGARCHLVLPPATFSQMDEAARRGLRNASHRLGFSPATGEPPIATNGASLIAVHDRGDEKQAYYSRDVAALVAGERWGVGIDHPLVVTGLVDAGWSDIPEEELERPTAGSASLHELRQSPSRPARLFGSGLVSNIIRPELEKAGLWLPGKLASIEYSDRYLAAPLPVLLMARTLAALRDQLASPTSPLPVLIHSAQMPGHRSFDGPPHRLNHNWPDEQIRQRTIEQLLVALKFTPRYEGTGAAHHRRLTLTYDDGRAALIFFDQGFGYWRTSGADKHDFRMSPPVQVQALLDCTTMVAGSGESFIAFAHR